MTRSGDKWPELRWDQAVDRISPCVFRVYADDSAGTAFIVSTATDKNKNKFYTAFATAWHVISGLVKSNGDLYIVSSDKKSVISSESCQIFFHPIGEEKYDTGLIIIECDSPTIKPKELPPLFRALSP